MTTGERGVPALASARPILWALGVAAAVAVLLARLLPDIRGAPIFEDESLAGLVASQPLDEVLATVILDRGGAPLHFVLAHLALELEPSPTGLRAVSVVFALATVPLLFDLGRRLGGPVAGLTAAACGATSEMLGIYGTFGRMYALFMFAAVLAVDLFVRALHLRTPRAALAASAAAWLLPAVHPFGLVLLGAEALVAAWVWRGRNLKAALPILVLGVALVPFALADLRLAGRFSAGLEGDAVLVTPQRVAAALGRALGGFAGGREPVFLLFVGLAAVGTIALWRRGHRPFLALCALGTLTLPVMLVVARSNQEFSDHLAARQFAFVLPFWTALVGVGVARLLEPLKSARVQAAAVMGIAVVALLAPSAVPDPRSRGSGTREAVAAPADWLRGQVGPASVLFPSAPVFLAALPESARGQPLPREQPILVTRSLARAELPAPSVLVAVPLDGAGALDQRALRAHVGAQAVVKVFPSWVVVVSHGPFEDERDVLTAIAQVLGGLRAATSTRTPALDGYLRQGHAAVCGSLESHGGRCE